MKVKVLAIASALAALGLASQASAAVMTITYTGTVTPVDSSGVDDDYDNLFGGGNLTGDAITAVFTYNTAFGTEVATTTTDERYGGSDYYNQLTGATPTNVITSATYTINGHSYTVVPDYLSIAQTSDGTSVASKYVKDTLETLSGASSIVQFGTSSAPTSLSTAFSGSTCSRATLCTGYIDTAMDTNGLYDDVDFTTSKVVVAAGPVSAAPEPASWALMIAGVGVAGAALRRRGKLAPAGSAVA